MKTVCLLFEIHQPFRLKKYRFYDIGADHYYYDDYANEEILKRLAYQSYIPAAKMLLEMIEGTPHCMASSGEMPKGSETEGIT